MEVQIQIRGRVLPPTPVVLLGAQDSVKPILCPIPSRQGPSTPETHGTAPPHLLQRPQHSAYRAEPPCRSSRCRLCSLLRHLRPRPPTGTPRLPRDLGTSAPAPGTRPHHPPGAAHQQTETACLSPSFPPSLVSSPPPSFLIHELDLGRLAFS